MPNMQTILEKFEQHMKSIDVVEDELLPPATDKEINATEKELSIKFPEDMRTFYKWHNGQKGIKFIFYEFRIYSLKEVVDLYKNGIKHCEPDYFEVEDESGVFKDCIANVRWIGIGDNGGNTILFLDMDPGAQGIPGQLLESCDGEPECKFSGIKEFIYEIVRKIEKGEIIWNENAGSFWPVRENEF